MFPKYVCFWRLRGRDSLLNTVLGFPLPPSYGEWRILSLQLQHLQYLPLEGGIRPWRAATSLLRTSLAISGSSLAAGSRMSMKLESHLLIKTDISLLSGRDDFTSPVERRVNLWSPEVKRANMLSILDLRIPSSTLDTRSTLPPNCDNQKCFQKLTNAPRDKIAPE